MNSPQTRKIAVLLAIFVFFGATSLHASADPFPMPEAIAPNVGFWTKVYTQYTTSQGIVHDNQDLDVIYEIIDLLPYDNPGGAKINRHRMKKANEKYEGILRQLAKDPNTANAACRRVADLLGGPPDSRRFMAAAGRVRCQVGQKDRFQAGLIRSGAYVDQIRDIFRARGLPEDLAYLPHVESSFNPNAYSKFGAAGMWQFTRSTGKRFMTVGYALDERRDPILATYAAAELLKENYEKLGSWALAITAYNHGAAGMQRAKSLHGDYTTIFKSYRSRSFKFASRNFYSEFLAARQVATDHQTYFGDLVLDRPMPSQTVSLQGYVSMDDLSRHFQISPEILKELNPALRQPVFDGQKLVPKGYSLRLPVPPATDETLTAAVIPASFFKATQTPSKFYTVQRGDTAGRVARTHGVTLPELILANNLDRRATIYPRQTLRIPVPGEHLREPAAPVSAPAEPILVASVASPEKNAQAPQPVVESTVADDDTTLADESAGTAPEETGVETGKEEDTSREEMTLAQADDAPRMDETPTDQKDETVEVNAAPVAQGGMNSLTEEASLTAEPSSGDETPATLQYPQPFLASLIPVTPLESPAAPLENLQQDAVSLQARNEQIVSADVEFERLIEINGRPVGIIRVEVEETLGHYAEWANVRTQQIRNLNKLRFGTVLDLHQRIKIPLHRIGADDFKQSRYEYHKRLQEDFFAVYRIGELQPYLVLRGDNYWTLCQEKFDIPMWLLKHCNPEADLGDLHIRQQLIIPIIEKRSTNDAAPELSGVGEPGEDVIGQADGDI